jgi:hypothetical protein
LAWDLCRSFSPSLVRQLGARLAPYRCRWWDGWWHGMLFLNVRGVGWWHGRSLM